MCGSYDPSIMDEYRDFRIEIRRFIESMMKEFLLPSFVAGQSKMQKAWQELQEALNMTEEEANRIRYPNE